MATVNPGVIFDFDDTLVYSHELFLAAQRQFAQHLKELGLFDEHLIPYLEERDIDNVRQAGYLATECFALALAQTYADYCAKYGRAADEAEQRQLLELGRLPFEQPPREMEGAREVLAELRERCQYRLVLFTQGEEEIQKKRVAMSGLDSYFDAVRIVPVKDSAALTALLAEQGLDPAHTWYVGNSLRSDINPALEAGLKAVHLTIDAWSYEHVPTPGGYHSISALKQFMELTGARRNNSEGCGDTT